MLETRILELDEFIEFKEDIGELFKVCFQADLDPMLWDWAYQKNPTGNPIIVVALDNNDLVGHYAMIPMPFILGKAQNIGYLSMTTMVHPNYRKYGLFLELATHAYSRALPGTFVYGFPNSNSAPGFKKRLNWDIFEEYQIATISSETLVKYLNSRSEHNPGPLNIFNREFLDWRLSKPGMKYQTSEGLVYKEFGSEFDLLATDESAISTLKDSKRKLNLLTKDRSLIKAASTIKPYLFGYRNFGSSVNLEELNPNLLMSDVF